MKRFMIVAFVMTAGYCSSYADKITAKFGAEFPGKMEFKTNGVTVEGDVNNGFSVGAEYLAQIGDQVSAGGGFEYLFYRRLSKVAGIPITGEPAFNFAPVYGTVRYVFLKETEDNLPFLKLNLGYNLIYGGNTDFNGNYSLNGGFYWGVGAGLEINRTLTIELMYSSYNGSASNGIDQGQRYNTIAVKAGYVFRVHWETLSVKERRKIQGFLW